MASRPSKSPNNPGTIAELERADSSRVKVPGVSVIVTAYNYAQYVGRAVESVLRQTYPVVEVIVVDDGSTDNTREVIAAFEPQVRYLYQTNAGLSAARNTGVIAASHELIAFLDADDQFEPEMIAILSAELEALPSDYGLVAGDCHKVNSDGEMIPQKCLQGRPRSDITTGQLILRNQFVADAVLARSSVLKTAGLFDTSLTSSEDRDLWIRISRISRIWFVPARLVRVQVHAGSMSTVAPRMMQNMARVLDKAAENTGNTRIPWSTLQRGWSFLEYQGAWMHRDAGNYSRGVTSLLRSVLLWPFFARPHQLNENYLFRLRSLRQFLMEWWRSNGQNTCVGKSS